MSFMQPHVEHMEFYKVETTAGTELIPADLIRTDKDTTVIKADLLAEYCEGEPYAEQQVERENGICARLTAPGYLDCTTWSGPFDTEQAALEFLEEMYGPNED